MCGGQDATTHQPGCAVIWCECPCHDAQHEHRREAHFEDNLRRMPDYSELGLRQGLSLVLREELDEVAREAHGNLRRILRLIDRAYMRNAPGPVHSDIAAVFYNINAALLLLRAITPMEDDTQPEQD